MLTEQAELQLELERYQWKEIKIFHRNVYYFMINVPHQQGRSAYLDIDCCVHPAPLNLMNVSNVDVCRARSRP